MTLETLVYEKRDKVGIVTLNRPQRLNAISFLMRKELSEVVDELRRDEDVRVVIFTGAPRPDGRPCFCAGADLKEKSELGAEKWGRLGVDSWDAGIIRALAAVGTSRDQNVQDWDLLGPFEKPTIAAIDGICTAGGLELAIACDLRVAAETAEISDMHMLNLGMLGSGGLQSRLPRLIGLAKAKQLIWTGKKIDGKEAWRIGLVNEVFPPGRLMEGALELATQIATMRPLALAYSKLVLNAGFSQSEYDSLRYSALAEVLLRTRNLEQVDEVHRAFSEKRRPATGE